MMFGEDEQIPWDEGKTYKLDSLEVSLEKLKGRYKVIKLNF